MMITDFLKGKWLKHPLHPILVHIPLATWPAALLFDLCSQLKIGGNTMVRLSFYSILFGLLAVLLAVPTGVIDWGEIKQDRPAWKLGLYHMAVNLVVSILFAINLGLRLENFRDALRVPVLPLILSGIGTLLLFLSAYLGGLMVYDYGIGVARYSKEKWRKTAQAAGARVPEMPEKQ
jgi:uncharacterized membrane protein